MGESRKHAHLTDEELDEFRELVIGLRGGMKLM